MNRDQRQEEFVTIEASPKRLEKSYQARVKVLEEREHERLEYIKALAPAKKEKEKLLFSKYDYCFDAIIRGHLPPFLFLACCNKRI